MINVQVQIANLIIGNWILVVGYLKKRIANPAWGYSAFDVGRSTFDVHLFRFITPIRQGRYAG